MPETWKTKLMRWRFNWYPAFRRTGARVVYMAEDLHELHVRLPLNRATRNLHGTIYGGAIYSAVDPLHAVIVARQLGPDFLVWMKAARVEFLRPGRGDLLAVARVERDEVAALRAALTRQSKLDRDYSLELKHASGEVAARVTVTIHIRRRPVAAPPMEAILFQT